MINKKISAIITTYNRPSSIVNRALLSIINQTYKVYEILIVDDNPFENDSDKELNEISKEIKQLVSSYENVNYIKNPNGNSGANFARNIGILNCHGEFLAFLDDDDEWLPQKIEKQLDVFNNSNVNDIGMVFSSGLVRKYNGKNIIEEDYYTYKNFAFYPKFSDLLREDVIGSTSQPLIKRKVFEEIGLFDIFMPARQDYDMWLRISKKYNVVGIKEKLFIHYHHSMGQISKKKINSYLGYNLLYYKYYKEYNNDIIAWLNIHCYIYYNQKGFIGSINSFLIRVLRKIILLLISLKVIIIK